MGVALRKLSTLLFAVAFAFVALLLTAGQANAQSPDVHYWEGFNSNNFSDAGNWQSGVVPENGDHVQFSSDASSITLNIDVTGLSLGSIETIGESYVTLKMTGNEVTVTDNITTNSNATLEIDNDITLGADVAFNTSEYSGLRLNGQVDIGSNTLTIDDGGSFYSVYFDDVISGAGDIYVNGSTEVTAANTVSGDIFVNNPLTISGGSFADANLIVDGVTNFGYVTYLINSSEDVTLVEDISVSASPYTYEGKEYAGTGIYIYRAYKSGAEVPDNVTMSGTITATTDFAVASSPDLYKTTIKLPNVELNGNEISFAKGASGKLIVGTTEVKAEKNKYTVDKDTVETSGWFLSGNEELTVLGTTGDITVQRGAVLKGSGTVGDVTVSEEGTLAPGESPGCINTGDLDLQITGNLEVETAGTTECTEYDRTNVTGTVQIGNANLNVLFLNGFTVTQGNSFLIIDNDGTDAVAGQFSGLAEGATFTAGGATFSITYTGGDGNDVVITATATPGSPDTGAALVGTSYGLIGLVTTLSAAGVAIIARKVNA